MLGRYGPEPFTYPSGRPASNDEMIVYHRGTLTLVGLFDDLAGTEPITNPTYADDEGNLTFVAEEGDYDLYPQFGGRLEISIGEPGLAGPPGPPGPEGPPGPAGPSGSVPEHQTISIATASLVWEGDHTLGFEPGGIQVKDQTGRLRFGFIVETLTSTHYKIVFSIPLIGSLILS